MRFLNRATCVGGLVLASTCLAACGSGGSLLSAYQANELKSQLDQVSRSLSAGQCQQAANQLSNFRSTVDGLGSVNQTLITNLDQGAATIHQLARRECPVVTHTVKPKPPKPTTTSTPTTNSTPTTSTPSTPTTQTTPATTTTPTTPTTPSTTGPGSGGVGLSGGGGNGNGKGGN